MRAVILALCSSTIICSAQPTADTTAAQKSPSTALGYSFLFPGLGQLYNEAYWKVPIFAGAAITSGYFVFANHASFATASQEYDAAITRGDNAATTNLLLRRREAYRNNRDLAGLALLLTYTLAAVDAYVGANLYDFNVTPELSLGIGPTPTQTLAVSMQLRY